LFFLVVQPSFGFFVVTDTGISNSWSAAIILKSFLLFVILFLFYFHSCFKPLSQFVYIETSPGRHYSYKLSFVEIMPLRKISTKHGMVLVIINTGMKRCPA
jgi:hypothetical protein